MLPADIYIYLSSFGFTTTSIIIEYKMKSTVALFLVIIACVSAHQGPVVLCGRQLANARVWLCYGSENVNKRGLSHNMLDSFSDDKSEEMEWPWSGRRGALSASWSRYKRGGLVDECCLKPCTTDVILNYC